MPLWQHRRLVRGIWRDWRAAGYERDQHLIGMTAEGDPDVLSFWRQDEADTKASPRPFATWLAAQDMWQIESTIRYREARRAR